MFKMSLKTSMKILEIIDDNKTDFPEGIYLKLCNELKDIVIDEIKREFKYHMNFKYIKPVIKTVISNNISTPINIELIICQEDILLDEDDYVNIENCCDHIRRSLLTQIFKKYTHIDDNTCLTIDHECNDCDNFDEEEYNFIVDMYVLSATLMDKVAIEL